jgi:hypothetical protein
MILSSTDVPSAGTLPKSSLPGVVRNTSVGARHVAIAGVAAARANGRLFASQIAAITTPAATAIVAGRILRTARELGLDPARA